MTRLWPEGEAIQVQTDAKGNPVRFIWRGHVHKLAQVQQRWQVDTDWWRPEGRIWRAYLAVTTTDGLFCVIYQDLGQQGWFLSKIYD